MLFLISIGYNFWQNKQSIELESNVSHSTNKISELEDNISDLQNELNKCIRQKKNLDQETSFNNLISESDNDDLKRKNRDMESKISDLEYKLRYCKSE